MRKLLESKFITPALLFLVFWTGLKTWDILVQRRQSDRDTTELDKKISVVQTDNEKDQRLQDYYHSDAYLERQARIKLNYKLPDEQAVFIYSKETNASAGANASLEDSTHWYNRWWRNIQNFLSR